MSQLKFWNKQNSSNLNKDKDKEDAAEVKNGTSKDDGGKNGKRNWLHTPEALINGHVVYLVKFFGNVPVDQPKGIEVVKDTIRKLQFAQQMKKAETGTQEKFKKIEITISVDGVALQDPRTQKCLHQFPLHNISYCADEKGVKKFFSFIAKNVKSNADNGSSDASNCSSNGYNLNGSMSAEETHECFVFISNKLASDITLTIGQAFELAFRKYINTTEKSELSKAQQQITELEKTITIYKSRLSELAQKVSKNDMEALLFKMGIKDILEAPKPTPAPAPTLLHHQTVDTMDNDRKLNLINGMNGKLSSDSDKSLLIDTNNINSSNSTTNNTSSHSPSKTSSFLPTVPPRGGGGGGVNLSSQILTKSSTNNQKMDELLLNSDSDSDFDPRADELNTEINSNGSSSAGMAKSIANDLFGFEPSKSFGQQLFYNNNDNKLQNNNNSNSNINNSSLLSNSSSNSFSEFTTPPLLAPPPKVAAPRRAAPAVTTMLNGSNPTDLFGSDPFEMNGPSIFPTPQANKISVDDFTLESLDPLRK